LAQPLISFIVPVFNEERVLRCSIEKLVRYLEKLGLPFEVIIANDGSSDKTLEEAQKLSLRDGKVKVYSFSHNMGRGEVIMAAASQSKGRVIAFTDIDMATDLCHLPELLYPVLDGSYEISIGSRWLRGADVKRKFTRRMISYCYNELIRFLFKSNVYDHQCGFKAFARPAFMVLLREMKLRNGRSWAWDTETLVRAQVHKFKIKEFPVKWREGRESKFKVLIDSIKIFRYIIGFKFVLSKEKHTPRILNHFDTIAISYDACDLTSERRFSIIFDIIVKIVNQQELTTLLDLGGGTGRLWLTIANSSKCESINYLLLDPSREMLKHAKSNIKDLQALLAVGEALPLRAGTINCITCSEVLEHVQNPKRILSQAKGILKDSGILIVSNPNRLWTPVEVIAEKVHLKPPEGPHRYLTPWDLRRELLVNHFIIIQEKSFVNPVNPSALDKLFSTSLGKNLALKSIIVCKKDGVQYDR